MKAASLNHVYRLIWSDENHAWVAVSEHTKGKGKSKALKLAAVLSSLFLTANPLMSYAGPEGGAVTSGDGSITQSGTTTTINQNSQTLNINWNTFNVASNETVNFIQPSATALAVNRILDTNGSRILGNINANGQVWLINPNGVYFGQGSQINVGSLLASTLNPLGNLTTNGTQVFGNGGTGSIINEGQITAANSGYVAFIGNTVSNAGTIVANNGAVALGAGSRVSVTFADNQLLSLTVDQSTLNNLAENKGLIQANGGIALMSAGAKDSLLASVVNNEGVIEANTVDHQNGKIILTSNHGMVNTGTLRARGEVGGQIEIDTKNLIDAGQYDVSGTTLGGDINIQASNHIEQTTATIMNADASNGKAGNISIVAGKDAFLSSTLEANGNGANGRGGNIKVTAPDLTLAGATVAAKGTQQGGQVSIGGGWQGKDASMVNANTTKVVASQIEVSATDDDQASTGNAGTAVIWSEQATTFNSNIQATGGKAAGNGGMVEVSSRGNLHFGGTVDASATHGNKGTLLLDPKNIEIIANSNTTTSYSLLNLADPTPSANKGFGALNNNRLVELKNNEAGINRIVIASELDDNNATDAGAVRLYNSQTGALISTLSGTTANDKVGNGGITSLRNGNYVVRSTDWNGSRSAVTWGNGLTGVTGAVSASNSLVGSTASDLLGNGGIIALSNGNYVVSSVGWDNGSIVDAGAATWGNGMGGTVGAVSASNSLVGSNASDRIGINGISELSNGNYLVRTVLWDNGTVIDAGAVTWGSGTTGVSGVVSASNSLVGTSSNDQVGKDSIVKLSNGNYVVSSSSWANFKGAVTWGDGTTGVRGEVSASNSLTGTNAGDEVGGGLFALSNGNYVVTSFRWNGQRGAVTWGSGTSGIVGTVSASNSLVGTNLNDAVGFGGVNALSNGNYLVSSINWNNKRGAVTWSSGTSGIVGEVSASNSLVGTSADDQVGSLVTTLSNGNYVVRATGWDNGSILNVGAATWGDGTTGVRGEISASNSLVGTSTNDQIGASGVFELSNGNYLVTSTAWDNGTVTNVGAVTWGSGTTGVTGVVSASNSLVGSTAEDRVGSGGVNALSNGNYVVRSKDWDNGNIKDAGAVTWGNGAMGIRGAVSASNSLVGSTANDQVGGTTRTDFIVLSNGNYVVRSNNWDNGIVTNAGAVTWGNGTTGISGAVSATNSLVGSTANDQVGSAGIIALSNGNYVVRSNNWDNDTVINAGAVTWGNGATGIRGAVSASNSLVGSTANDQVGGAAGNDFIVLSNGNYVVRSDNWDNGTVTNAGAVTWGSGTTGVSGMVSASNSLVGTSKDDQVGANSVTPLSNGNYIVSSSIWDNGTVTNAGAVTWGSGTTGVSGTVSASNSLVGTTVEDRVGGGSVVAIALSDGRAVIGSPSWDNGSIVNAGRIDILGPASATPVLGNNTYSDNPSSSSQIQVESITNILNAGTNVVLQANNDITLSTALTANNPTGNGGALTLQAGRSVLLNANITTDNGDLNIIANDKASNGVVNAHRDAGTANITMATGTSINAGTGNVSFELRDGAGLSNNASGNITLNEVNANTIQAVNTGATAGSGVVLNGTLATSATTGNAIEIAGKKFTNNTGSSVFSTQSGSRWLVWSGNPQNDTRGGLVANFKQYNASYGSSTILGTGNGLLYTIAPTISASLTGIISKVYDGNTTATLNSTNYQQTGAIDRDTVSLNNPITGTYITAGTGGTQAKDAATGKTVNVNNVAISSASNGNTTVYGYQMANTNVSTNQAEITTKAVTLTAGNVSKVYDGKTTYSTQQVDRDTLSAVLQGSDKVTAATITYTDQDAGSNKTVNLTNVTIDDGNNGNNYTVIALNGNNTSTITKAQLRFSTVSVSPKEYDGNNNAIVNLSSGVLAGNLPGVTGLVGDEKFAAITGDSLNRAVTATGKFATTDAGTQQVNNLVYTFGDGVNGAKASNYEVIQASLTGTIQPRNILLNGAMVTAENKVYDGSGNAKVTVSGGVFKTYTSISGNTVHGADNQLIGNERLGLTTATGLFENKNAGDNKNVNVNYQLTDGTAGDGFTAAKASNYRLITALNGIDGSVPYTIKGSIFKKELTLSGANISVADKPYDGTNTATLTMTGGSLTGFVNGESLNTPTASGLFDDKNAGNQEVTVKYSLDDKRVNPRFTVLASNYFVADSKSQATITPIDIRVSGVSAADKTYDGTNAATILNQGTLNTLIKDESLNLTTTGSFADQGAGISKTVNTLTTLADSKNGLAKNYNLINAKGSTTADIDKATLTYVARPVSVLQSQTPALTGTVTGYVAGEDFAGVFGAQTANWASPNANLSTPGVYSVIGSGLVTNNYTLVQDAANDTALTVTSAAGQSITLLQQVQAGAAPGVSSTLIETNINNISPAAGNGNQEDEETATNASNTDVNLLLVSPAVNLPPIMGE